MSHADDVGRIIVEKCGPVTLFKMSNPPRRNALSMRMREELYAALVAANDDRTCRAIVLAGDGAHFCSGGDISSFSGVTPVGGRARMQNIHRILRRLQAGRIPVIAAVEGAAIGAGTSIASACDIIVAAQDAKFALPFTRFGLVADWGALWSVPLRIGVGRAKLMMMSGRIFDGEAADRLGLVDLLALPGSAVEEAMRLAADIAAGAPLSNEMMKSIMVRGLGSLEEAFAVEADAQGVLYGTEDYVEGYTAFLEKRQPEFKGQ